MFQFNLKSNLETRINNLEDTDATFVEVRMNLLFLSIRIVVTDYVITYVGFSNGYEHETLCF